MKKFFLGLNCHQWQSGFIIIKFTLTTLILSSCNITEIPKSGTKVRSTASSSDLVNKAYIFRDNPYIIEGTNFSLARASMKGVVDKSTPELITTKSQLKSDCMISLFTGADTIADCIQVFKEKSATQQLLTRPTDGSWEYPVNSAEFYQVNNHYHVNLGVKTFFEKISFAFETLHSHPSFASKIKSIPQYLGETDLYWFKPTTPPNDNYFRNSYLSSFAICDLELNASFNPAGPELCFGKWSKYPNFFFTQDPSIIYHELGHAMTAVMMNFRNGVPGFTAPTYHPLRSNFGGYGYDETGAIGEAIADYFSFMMNERTHIGEWALKKTVSASRPLSEDDEMHIPGIDTTSEGRLSYPNYILYDPNDPNVPFEDVHYAGQIPGHYLIALTREFQNQCSLPSDSLHKTATSYVMFLIAETLAELGDLNAIGIDNSLGGAYNPFSFSYRFNNLDENASYVWTQIINPPTFRRFFQIFAKNIKRYITEGLCPSFTKNESEKLLDDYGLLLFKTYNDNGSSTKSKFLQVNQFGVVSLNVTPVAPTAIQENNRRKSVLVSKTLLDLADVSNDDEVATYYIIDDQENIRNILQNLLYKGFPIQTTTGTASYEYNNSNIKISPGEVVAIIPNLTNKSNSTMAGIQITGTDWDHVHITDTSGVTGNYTPCVVDTVTTASQGAESALTCSSTLTEYRRHVKNSLGSFRTDEVLAPVCLVQLEDDDSAKWVSQNEYRKKQGLSLQDKDCLGYGATQYTADNTFNPHECLVRILPGMSKAFYSKIDPQKSYIETMRNGNPDHSFGVGNALLFEVNKWIPPGTKFRCRLRARFSNCSDCFSDSSDTSNDEYIDAELNGAAPYKILNFEFEVND